MTQAGLWVRFIFLLFAGSSLQVVAAQTKPDGPDAYGAKNTFGVIAEYANDSSRIILGRAENVKLSAVGLQYSRRLVRGRLFDFSYAAEFRPVILESIPTVAFRTVQSLPVATVQQGPPELTTKCVASSRMYQFQDSVAPVTLYSETVLTLCGRQMNYAQGISPVGFGMSFRPRHRLQPTFRTLEGYIFSTKPLPISTAGSFNFVFELGFGEEYFVAARRSVRLEYQVQHYSNGYTADQNPGVDSGMFKLTYSFGP